MWEINNVSQIYSFFYSILLGMFFCCFYDFFRSIRFVKKTKVTIVILQDLLYFSCISIITFIFLLSVSNGEIRAYIIFGILIGFFLFYKTISIFFKKLLIFIFNGYYKFFCAFNRRFYLLFDKIYITFATFSKNCLKCFKKGLKIPKGLLYTIKK